jgi:hypothetical protein
MVEYDTNNMDFISIMLVVWIPCFLEMYIE